MNQSLRGQTRPRRSARRLFANEPELNETHKQHNDTRHAAQTIALICAFGVFWKTLRFPR